MRQIWLDEFNENPKKSDWRFIKVHDIEQLRRLLSTKFYGTKNHLKFGDWEAPFLQELIDREKLLDIGHNSEVIDINKAHQRKKIFDSVARLTKVERELSTDKNVKYGVRKTSLR